MSVELQNKLVNEAAQLAFEKYQIEKRLGIIEKRLEEITVVTGTINTVMQLNNQDKSPSGDE